MRILCPPRNHFRNTVFGFAIHPQLASIYYEYAVRLAEKDNAEYEIPLILGSIMAHEIGHLILGTSSHFSEGIMKPRWARQQINQILTGNLVFTSEQSQILRARAGFYLRAASEIKTQDFIAARAYPAKGDR